MKVLYITSLYSPYIIGGAEISIQILVEAMHKKGHEVVVLSTCDKNGLHEDTVNGIKVYRAGIKNKYWHYEKVKHSAFDKLFWHLKDTYNKEMQVYLKEVLDVEKPDIVSCHNITGWSVAIWDTIKKYQIPMVQVLHDFYLLCINSNMFKSGDQCKKQCIECRTMRYLHRKKSAQVDAVVGISQYMLNKISEVGYFKNSLKVVIANSRVIPKLSVMDRKNKGYAIIFGFIGTLAPNKGVQWLIEQFKKIDSKNISLKIAGRGDSIYEKSLQAMAQDDDRISFLGYTKSEEFYSQIDVLIVPSLWDEPLGMVAIEACARHIPVITTATGGLKEIITDGYNGLHCNTTDLDSLFIAISKIVNDEILLKELRHNARKSVMSFLDLKRLTREYETVYKHIIK